MSETADAAASQEVEAMEELTAADKLQLTKELLDDLLGSGSIGRRSFGELHCVWLAENGLYHKDALLGSFPDQATVTNTLPKPPFNVGLRGTLWKAIQGAVGVSKQAAGPSAVPEEPPRKCRKMADSMTPSAMGEHQNRWRIQQVSRPSEVPCFEINRDFLRSPEVLQLVIMCPAFGRFVELYYASNPPSDCLALAIRLCNVLEPYYPEEQNMAHPALEVLNSVFPRPFPMIKATFHGTRTGACSDPKDDGESTYGFKIPGHTLACGVVRVEFRLTSNASDPLIQNLAYEKDDYNKIVAYLNNPDASSEHKLSLLRWYPFPTIIITITEVDVQISGAVISGTYAGSVSVRSQFLSAKHQFVKPQDDIKGSLVLGRVIYALRESAVDLYNWYKTVAASDAPLPPTFGKPLLSTPSVPSIPPPAPLTELPYHPLPYGLRSFIPEPEHVTALHLLWRGAPHNGLSLDLGSIVVKYAQQYDGQVHRRWADQELAPRLLYPVQCMPGGYLLVVMEVLEAQGYTRVSALKTDAEFSIAKQLAQELLDKVPGKTVHGDLRMDNAMLSPADESGGRMLKFVDFDWAGEEGKVTYPGNINMDVFKNGANPYQPIMQLHDRQMVASWAR